LICVCRHARAEHDEAMIGTPQSYCRSCTCRQYRAQEHPVTGWARMLVREGFDLRRKCACGHLAGMHQRVDPAPSCVWCGRLPDTHQIGTASHAYRAPPPEAGCYEACGCLRFSEPQVTEERA
jgi:hypothetical protein